MRSATKLPVAACRPRPVRGFTLIEVMIVVAIIGILSAIAYPSYRDYIIRGRLNDATNGLTAMQADMERYFQDNRTYQDFVGANGTAYTSPCSRPAAQRTFANFLVSCTTGPTVTAYTLTAAGAGSMAGFGFTYDQNRAQTTTTTVTGWTAAAQNVCWVTRRGQTC